MFEDLSEVSLTDTNFIGNIADYGAAGMMRTESHMTCTRCTFDGNSASRYGGALYIEQNSYFYISKSEFVRN